MLLITGSPAKCQDYEGNYCNSTLIYHSSTYGTETFCISFSNYDGDQISVCFKVKGEERPFISNEIYYQVSPGVFETKCPPSYLNPQNKFCGKRVKFITSEKVVYEMFWYEGTLLEKIIYKR